MSIFVVGLNFRTAALSLREKYFFPAEKVGAYLQDLLARGIANEAVLLSTCNRSELYCEAEDESDVVKWFTAQADVLPSEIIPSLYVYRDEIAIMHMMHVATGLDSLVLGEPQILGQLKDAFSESITAGAVDALFHRLFQNIFMVAKEIRTTTAIGACPVSIASTAVNLAAQRYLLKGARILLVGAGDTISLLLRYLKPQFPFSISIVNRDFRKAKEIAKEFNNVHVYSLHALPDMLIASDVIFSATGSPTPLITTDMVEYALNKRKFSPMTFIDLAVPRDVEPEVRKIRDVRLYCVDDLVRVIEQNKTDREHGANQARVMIAKRCRALVTELSNFDHVAHTIRMYRSQIEAICSGELNKAKEQLEQGEDAEEVLELFAKAYTQKLLHAPSVQLRQAGFDGRMEVLQFAKQLFDIQDGEAKAL